MYDLLYDELPFYFKMEQWLKFSVEHNNVVMFW